jgi:protein TonB
MTPRRQRSAASRISPAAIAISVAVHAALAGAAALMTGLVEAPTPHLVVPVEIAFDGAAADTSPAVADEPTTRAESADEASATEPLDRSEAPSAAMVAAAEADSPAPIPTEPEVAAVDPPKPATEQTEVEIVKAPPEREAVAAAPSHTVRDVPPPPAKPTPPRVAAPARSEDQRQAAAPAIGKPEPVGADATSQVARAIDQTKSGAGQGPSVAVARSYGNEPPVYPDLARRRGWEGRVVLRVVVDATGQATDVGVETSSGYRMLDDAALAAVERWRFEPARLAGIPVVASVDVPVTFRLTD